jgi:hypothetical protein
MTTEQKTFDLSSGALHLLAMALMLCDHLWATVLPQQGWLTCVGRIAFPIFAFMAVEGYFHTRNFKKYLLRLLAFAVVSEIPFDLMYEGTLLNPFHQNVLWTFLLGLLGIRLIETVRSKGRLWATVLTAAAVAALGYLLGTVTMADYYGPGVLTVLAFYFFHGRKWWCYAGQAAALCWINLGLLGGRVYPVELLGRLVELPQQGLAMLALVPIWLYRGRQGYHSRAFQYACYAFYPVHLLILAALSGAL